MTTNIVRLLPDDEQAVLECYVRGSEAPASFEALFDAMEVPANATPDRLQIAVAQILLHHVQDSLPQWAAVTGDEILTNRKRHLRHKDALLRFHPQLLFAINWATSGPGYEWPEVYHVAYLPGFEKLVFTASRDGDDAWGCADHAIGVGTADALEEAARKVLTAYWQEQADGRDQQRWESCIEEGLIDFRTANAWADEVWPEEDHSTGPRTSAGATMPVSEGGNPLDALVPRMLTDEERALGQRQKPSDEQLLQQTGQDQSHLENEEEEIAAWRKHRERQRRLAGDMSPLEGSPKKPKQSLLVENMRQRFPQATDEEIQQILKESGVF